MNQRLREFWIGLPTSLVILCGLLLTILTSWLIYSISHRETLKHFNEIVDSIITPIETRISRYENSLLLTRAFFIANKNEVSRVDFTTYVSHMELLDLYPGAQGLGFTMRVPQENVKAKNGRYRYQGEEYKLWPLVPERD